MVYGGLCKGTALLITLPWHPQAPSEILDASRRTTNRSCQHSDQSTGQKMKENGMCQRSVYGCKQ